MENSKESTLKAFGLMVFALVFIAAWQFWTSLQDGQVFDNDLMAPIAYGFAALAGAFALLRFGRTFHPNIKIFHWLPTLGALILIIAPFVFFFLRSPLVATIAQIKYWIGCLGIVGGMIYLLVSQRFSAPKKTGLILSILVGVISPVMPWVGIIIFTPNNPLGDFTWPIANYGLWFTAIIWAGTAWLMIREHISKIKLQLTTIFLAGLALFLVGIYNPVQFSSQTYQYSSYVGGALVNQGLVDLANLNFTLLAGMGLILFSLSILFIQKTD